MTERRLELAERVRQACLEAARQAYQDASQSGLCEEGALEVALGAIDTLDLTSLLDAADSSS